MDSNSDNAAMALFAQRLADLSEAVERSKAMLGESRSLLARLRSSTGQAVSTDVAFHVFEGLLKERGIRAALAYLRGLSPYRFVSIFRFQDGMATSVVHVDRDAPEVLQAAEVPDTATYCCYVREERGAFVTADAQLDARTADHPAKDAIRSYCGVPVLTPEGELIGTLCHYDTGPQDASSLDQALLLRVSSALTHSGLVPDYPRR